MPREIKWDDTLVNKFWDYYSDKTDTYFAEAFGDVFVSMFQNLIKNDSICVDYGCGSGGLIKSLLKYDNKVIGIDNNKMSVENIRQRFSFDPNFHGAYHAKDSFQDLKADIIFSLEAIEHVLEGALPAYFKTLQSLLNDNGYLIISCPNDENIESAKVYCPISDTIFHPTQHVRSLNEKSIKKIIEAYDFEFIKSFTMDLQDSFSYSKINWIKNMLRETKAKMWGYKLKKPHLIAVFKKT